MTRLAIRSMLITLTGVVVLTGPVSARQDAPRLVGAVTDRSTGSVLGAAVVLVDGLVVAVTRDDGRFRSPPLSPGSHEVTVRRIGYRPATASIRIDSTSSGPIELLVTMEAQALELDPIEVTGERPERRWLEIHGFYDRMREGGGQYLTRREIENRNTSRVRDLFSTLLGRGYGRTGCAPTVFVDGVFLGAPDFDDVFAMYKRAGQSDVIDMLEMMISVDDIAGIEVYRGPSQIPARFNRVSPGSCFGSVVVVWTR